MPINTKAAIGGVLKKKWFFKNFVDFTGKHLFWSLFLIKFNKVGLKWVNSNPLHFSVAFLYPLKTSENLKVFLIFSGGIENQHRAVLG